MNRRDIIRMVPAAFAAGNVSAAADAFGGKARLRNAICAYSYREELKNKTLRYEDLVRIAVENDADGLDLTVYWMPPEPGDDFLMPLRRIAFRNAVEIYSISIRTDLCRPTRDLQEREVETISKWVDVAAKLGAGHIRVFGGAVPKGATEEQAAQWATEVLKRAAECSSKKGIVLGLENHGGVTEKAERILQIVKAVNSPWAGINLDTGNFKTNAFPQVEMCIPHAVNVQVKTEIVQEDGKRGPADWDRIIRMLVKGGYKGYLALEYEGKNNAEIPALTRKLGALVRRYNA